jgi:alpha-L-fucosidase 2
MAGIARFKACALGGGYEVTMEWKNGKLLSAQISNCNGGSCTVRYGKKNSALSVKPGETVRLSADFVSNN